MLVYVYFNSRVLKRQAQGVAAQEWEEFLAYMENLPDCGLLNPGQALTAEALQLLTQPGAGVNPAAVVMAGGGAAGARAEVLVLDHEDDD